jgi:hypothetical protein
VNRKEIIVNIKEEPGKRKKDCSEGQFWVSGNFFDRK